MADESAKKERLRRHRNDIRDIKRLEVEIIFSVLQ